VKEIETAYYQAGTDSTDKANYRGLESVKLALSASYQHSI